MIILNMQTKGSSIWALKDHEDSDVVERKDVLDSIQMEVQMDVFEEKRCSRN